MYINICENVVVDNWFKQKFKHEVLAVISLLADNLNNFKKMYGVEPQVDAQFKNQLFWSVQYQSISYMLVCLTDINNTVYYVQYNGTEEEFHNDFSFGTYIIEFLEYLLKNKMLRNLS